MRLKRKLTNEEFSGLSDEIKASYVENPSRAGEFLLDVEPDAEAPAFKRARDAEKKRADEAEARVAELTEENEGLQTQLASSKPDVEKLGNEYKTKEQKLKDAHKVELSKKDAQIAEILVDRQALELAQKISTVPELVVDAIKRRLKVGVDAEGKPVAEVLDGNGLATTSTIEDLGKEFVANPKYGAIMIGSNASGSGASHQKGGSGASYKSKKFDELSEAERIAWNKDDPKSFEAASEKNATEKQRV